jgi:hypothetical protein
MFADWLSAAESLAEPGSWTASAALRSRPVLFVGLGDTGFEVLRHVANYLRGRWGDPWPNHVRLLHIGVSEEPLDEEGTPAGRDGFRSLVLPFDKDLRRRLNLGQAASRVGPMDEARVGRPRRALGPLAIVADLTRGMAKSRLWPALANAIGDLTDLSVYVIADAFSDEASGMIADVGHLLRQVDSARQIGIMMLLLAAHRAGWHDDLTDGQRAGRTFATVRELQRLECVAAHFSYASGLGQPKLDAPSHPPLFDEIYLLDGVTEERSRDLSKIAARDGLLPAMATSLIALLNPRISRTFYEHTDNELTESARGGGPSVEYRASAMGSYALRLPVEEMRQILESRLVHQCLFDLGDGLIPWEELDEEGKPRRKGAAPHPDSGPSDASEFLREQGLSVESAQQLGSDDFERRLRDYLEVKLNGRDSVPLTWARDLCVALQKRLPGHSSAIMPLEQALQSWISAVGQVEEGEAADDPFADILGISTAGSIAKASDGPLYRAWLASWDRAQEIFARAARMRDQKLLWEAEQERAIYDRHLAPVEPWKRMQSRLWWRWHEDRTSVELRLLILPHDLEAQDKRHGKVRDVLRASWLAHSLCVTDPEEIVQRLLASARLFTGRLADQGLALGAQEIENRASELRRNSTCLYMAPEIGEEKAAVIPFCYLSAPDHASSRELARAIQSLVSTAPRPGVVGDYKFHYLPSDDPTECRILQVQHVLPLDRIAAFDDARKRYTPRPEAHVFRSEQIAAAWETRAARGGGARDAGFVFSPRFVSVLTQRQEEIRLFGQCLIYGLLNLNPRSRKITGLEQFEDEDHLGRWGEESAGLAVSEFLDRVAGSASLAQRLAMAIQQRRPPEYSERIRLLDAFRDSFEVHGEADDDLRASDLMLVARAVLQEEESSA